jgi:nitroreductase
MENLEHLIKERRTVNQFKPEKVDDALVMKALELSLWAPNHKLTFPWEYRVVTGEKRRLLTELAVELKKAKNGGVFSEVKADAVRKNLAAASHWVSLGVHRSENPSTFQEDQLTLACSVQIASMYLWDQGVGSKWSTGGYTLHPKTYEILGVDPQKTHLMGMLLIGVPEVIPAARPRPSLDQVLK